MSFPRPWAEHPWSASRQQFLVPASAHLPQSPVPQAVGGSRFAACWTCIRSTTWPVCCLSKCHASVSPGVSLVSRVLLARERCFSVTIPRVGCQMMDRCPCLSGLEWRGRGLPQLLRIWYGKEQGNELGADGSTVGSRASDRTRPLMAVTLPLMGGDNLALVRQCLSIEVVAVDTQSLKSAMKSCQL